MTLFLFVLVLTLAGVACAKAYYAATLATKDPEAFARWDEAENERRRRRQALLGKAILAAARIVKGWFAKETD